MNLIKSCCLFVVFSSFLACTSQVSDVKSVSYTEFVNPFIGTDFTGNTYPGAQAPFGMVQLSPDNGLPGWDRISGYFYPDSTIAGFSHTHLSGTGAGDLYDISFMPVTLPYKEAEAPLGIHSLFSHSEESASAGYYQVRLKDYNINVELTATERCGIQRYTFPKADAAVFVKGNPPLLQALQQGGDMPFRRLVELLCQLQPGLYVPDSLQLCHKNRSFLDYT